MQSLHGKLVMSSLNILLRNKRPLSHVRRIAQHTYLINNSANKRVSLTTNFQEVKNKLFFNHSGSRASKRYFSSDSCAVDSATYEKACEETLESLCDYFEELVENATHLRDTDVTYSDGVLTINFGNPYGTYVINRQSPNQQIWLSSPTSGPKRYDLVENGNYWIYKHDNVTLHTLLQEEIAPILKTKVDFSKCAYSLL